MAVEVRDLGVAKLKSELATLGKSRVTLGYQGPSGAAKHPEADASVAEVAAYNEYGTSTAPARPFLRTTMDRQGEALHRQLRKGVSDLIDGRADEADEVLSTVGETGVEAIRQTIDDAKSWAEPLSPVTVAAKGHDRPLVDTKVMRDSASWAIRRGGTIVQQGGEA